MQLRLESEVERSGSNIANNRSPGRPVIFVHIGDDLPSYALHSLTMASRTLKNPLVLLHSANHLRPIKGVKTVKISENWYRKDQFQILKSSTSVDKLFRQGFWLHAIERLFVLRDFAKHYGLNEFFHSELDILFLVKELDSGPLDSFATGIFLPPEGPQRALASLIYVNETHALDKLIDFIQRQASLGNEMKLLGFFLMKHPELAHALPSDRIFDQDWPFGHRSSGTEFGLVDSSGFGQFIFGPDPRNSTGSTYTRYTSKGLSANFEGLQFQYRPITNRLQISEPKGRKFSVVSLHVHSKIFSILRFRVFLTIFFAATNLGVKLPIRLSVNGLRVLFLRLSISPRALRLLTRLTTRSVKLYYTIVFHLLRRSEVVLSNRQRARFQNLLSLKGMESIPTFRDGIQEGKKISFTNGVVGEPRPLSAMSLPGNPPIEVSIFMALLKTEMIQLVAQNSRGEYFLCDFKSVGRKQPLFVAREKNYDQIRLARFVWGSDQILRSLNFSNRIQVVQPSIVREMFPNGQRDILAWYKEGQSAGVDVCALDTYGIWLFSRSPGSFDLEPECLNPWLPTGPATNRQ